MPLTEFHSIFEISNNGYSWWFLLLGLLPIFVGIGTLRAKSRIWAMGFIALGLLWLIICWQKTYVPYRELTTAYRNGNYSTTIGVISQFRPMPSTGHSQESFEVNGIHFSYSNFVITPCYNKTRQSGGELSDGMVVKISYKNGCILSLAVAQ